VPDSNTIWTRRTRRYRSGTRISKVGTYISVYAFRARSSTYYFWRSFILWQPHGHSYIPHSRFPPLFSLTQQESIPTTGTKHESQLPTCASYTFLARKSSTTALNFSGFSQNAK
jgi:hypothetical protein